MRETAAAGRFQILQLLGKGGMGEVFLAEDAVEHREVALKFLNTRLGRDAGDFFKEEVRLLSRLSHPNLVKIYDYFEGEPPLLGPYFAMEYVSGSTLDRVPKATRALQWVTWLTQLTQGLHYLHSRKILHGDLKPSNILVSELGDIKLLDFGLSAILTRKEGASALGTFAYMPPEAFWGDYDAQSDLFSMGVLFYEVLSGHLPFAKPLSGAVDKIPAPESLAVLRPDLPEYFCDLIHRLLEIRPPRRPPTARSVLKFLNQHTETPVEILDEASSQLILQKVPLVGRTQELAAFREALKSGTGLRPGVVSGPAGVGRSRLVEEMKWITQLQGLLFFSCGPEDSTHWLEAAAEGLGFGGGTGAPIDFFSRAQIWLAKFPVRQSVLALTDLHLWPESSLQELKIFLSLLEKSPAPLLLILEFGSDLVPKSLAALLALLPAGKSLELKDLPPEQTRELIVQASVDAPLPEATVSEIVTGSGGRPLLALEAVYHLLAGKAPGSALRSLGEGGAKSLAEITALRVQGLDAAEQELLAWVVTHPQPVLPAELHALWQRKPEALAKAQLTLEQQGILAGRSGAEAKARLAHPSLREAYGTALPAELRREVHHRWLVSLSPPEGEAEIPGTRALLLYHHALGAEDPGALKKWGFKAAEQFQKQSQDSTAVEVYRRIFQEAETAYERSFTQAHLAPLLTKLGRFDEAIEAYDLWYKDREDDASFLQKVKHRFYTGLVLHTALRETEAKACLEESLKTGDSRLHPAHRPYHARAHSLLAFLEERQGRFEAARDHLRTALELAQGHPLLMGEIEQRLGRVAQLEMKDAEALGHFERSLAHFREAKNPQAEAIAHNLLGMLHLECGRWQAAAAAMVTALQFAKRGGDLLQWGRYRVNAAIVFLELGRYSEAAESMEEGRLLLAGLGSPEDHLLTEIHRLSLFMGLGNTDRTLQILRSLGKRRGELEQAQLKSQWFSTLGELSYLRGRYGEAEAYFAVSGREAGAKLIDRSMAAVGSWKTAVRRGAASTLHLPPPAKTPIFEPWRVAAAYFLEPEASFPSEKFKQLLLAIQACEKPEWRLDLYDLTARHLKKTGRLEWAQRLHEAARTEYQGLLKNLTEEYRMDFEKNREPKSLDATLEELLPSSATASAGKPSASSPKEGLSAEAVAKAEPPQISEARFRQFSEINRQISQKNDLKEILERVMDAAIELTGAERGFLLLKKPGSSGAGLSGFDIKTARHLNQRSLQEAEFKFSMTAVEQAIQQGNSLLTDNAQLDPRFQERQSVVQYQLKSILAVPLEIEGQILGAIYLDHRYQPGCFAEEDVVLLSAFASQAALAIQKAQFIEELRLAKQKLEVKVDLQAKEIESLHGELAMVRDELKFEYKEIVGQSPPMMQVFQLLDHVTETTIPVWILGESGTGKELIAHALHANSPRKDGHFVSENCSAIPETLLESELFGHKKGAFTHADRDRVGLFEQASRGTLFLDEIADMPMSMQVKLLRVLQEGEVRPLGANKKVKVDVRLVTASNRDLNQMVKEGKFRQDLFFRINGLTIKLPPLRERKDDIPLLVNHIIEKVARNFNLKASEVSDEAFQKLLHYPWPGNIRELEGVVRNALLFAKGRLITPELLSIPDARSGSGGGGPLPPSMSHAMPSEEESAERQLILDALKRHDLDKEKAADALGISLRSLYTRMEKLNIPKKKTVLAKYLDAK